MEQEQGKAAVEGEVDPTAGWSEEDKLWLGAHVPDLLKPVAVRHGRKLFQLVMMAGAANHGLTVIAAQGRGNRALGQASFVLQNTLNALALRCLLAEGFTQDVFLECKEDVERLAALADTGQAKTGERVSKGGIVLDS